MKILKLSHIDIGTAKAVPTNDIKNGKIYFNLTHGTVGKQLWMWLASLDYKFFKPEEHTGTLELVGDDYVIRPIYKHGKMLKDKKGNVHYSISKDQMTNHTNDVLLLWEIPNYGCANISYTTNGMVSVLGEGSTGRERGKDTLSAPAPILEIYGDATLTWTGSNTNKSYTQTIKYDIHKKSWDIKPVETKELT